MKTIWRMVSIANSDFLELLRPLDRHLVLCPYAINIRSNEAVVCDSWGRTIAKSICIHFQNISITYVCMYVCISKQTTLLTFEETLRIRASSCRTLETDLPQKLHDKYTVRGLRMFERKLAIFISSSARFSQNPHELRQSM